MKNNKEIQNEEKKPFIKTKTKMDGSKEVIVTKNPANTWLGKTVAIVICVLTMFVGLIGLIYLLTQI